MLRDFTGLHMIMATISFSAHFSECSLLNFRASVGGGVKLSPMEYTF